MEGEDGRGWKGKMEGEDGRRFGDMGLIELRKTNTFQPQSHF